MNDSFQNSKKYVTVKATSLIWELEFLVSAHEQTTKTGRGQNRFPPHISTTEKLIMWDFFVWFFLINCSKEHCASECISYNDHLSDLVIWVFCLVLAEERPNYPTRFSCLSHAGINEADSSPGRTSSQKGVSANLSFIQPPLFCLLKKLELEELLKIWYLVYWKDDVIFKQFFQIHCA